MSSVARTSKILLTLIFACDLGVACRNTSGWEVDRSLTREESLGDNLILRRTSGGFGGTYWEGVEILQQYPKKNGLKKSLYSVRIGDAGDCNETSVHVTPDPAAKLITIRCGTSPYVYGRVQMP